MPAVQHLGLFKGLILARGLGQIDDEASCEEQCLAKNYTFRLWSGRKCSCFYYGERLFNVTLCKDAASR